MSNPLLLIVDGESLRTPGLISAMEGDGWEVCWLRSADAQAFLEQGRNPDLLLVEPSASGGGGYALAQRLQERRPGLPVLVLSETSAPGSIPQGQGMAVEAYLERTQPGNALALALRKYRPEAAKLSRDDIFGDLLQDLEQEADPAPTDPFRLFHQAPAQAAPPPPGAEGSSRSSSGSLP